MNPNDQYGGEAAPDKDTMEQVRYNVTHFITKLLLTKPHGRFAFVDSPD